MPKARAPAARAANRRGSPEAIEKRRAARMFNDVLGGRAAGPQLDGRTEKRRQRLLRELEQGRGARELKRLDVLQHVQQLLDLGETVGAIRKVAKPRKPPVTGEAMVDVVGRLHKAYRFRPEAYRFLGIPDEVLRTAGVLAPEKGAAARRARG